MLLSIVVPIYNVEKYLPKCVDSLLNQDLSKDEYEIILVDDGAKDKSAAIADDYASKYTNVVTIHQANGGLSAARNTGIQHAKGKYIQFVDSDDYLEPNVIKTLVDKMEQDNLDVLRFNYQNVNEQYEVFQPYKFKSPFIDYTDKVCDGVTFLNTRLGYNCYAVQFLIKKELLIANSIFFKPGIYFEDTDWAPRLLLQSSRVTSLNLVVYNYLMRVGSITQSVEDAKKRKVLGDKLLLIDNLLAYSKDVADKRWFEGMIAHTTISILDFVALNYYSELTFYSKSLKRKSIFPLSKFNMSISQYRKISVINISIYLYCFLIHIRNK